MPEPSDFRKRLREIELDDTNRDAIINAIRAFVETREEATAYDRLEKQEVYKYIESLREQVEESGHFNGHAEDIFKLATRFVALATIDDVKSAVRDGDFAAKLALAAEREGPSRITLTSWLEAYI